MDQTLFQDYGRFARSFVTDDAHLRLFCCSADQTIRRSEVEMSAATLEAGVTCRISDYEYQRTYVLVCMPDDDVVD